MLLLLNAFSMRSTAELRWKHSTKGESTIWTKCSTLASRKCSTRIRNSRNVSATVVAMIKIIILSNIFNRIGLVLSHRETHSIILTLMNCMICKIRNRLCVRTRAVAFVTVMNAVRGNGMWTVHSVHEITRYFKQCPLRRMLPKKRMCCENRTDCPPCKLCCA